MVKNFINFVCGLCKKYGTTLTSCKSPLVAQQNQKYKKILSYDGVKRYNIFKFIPSQEGL